MKNKDELLKEVLVEISTYVDKNDLDKVENILYTKFYGYSIVKEETNVAICNQDTNINILKRFLTTKLIEGKSERTIKRYKEVILRLLDFFSNKSIFDYTADDIRYWLCVLKTKNKVSNTTLDGMRRIIASFFNWLEKEDIISKSPARKLSIIKNDTKQEEAFTESQVEKMAIMCTNERNRAIIEMLYATGCRVSELCQVNLSDVDFNSMTVLLHGKGGKDRVVPFTDKAKLYLDMYLNTRTDNNQALFVTLNKSEKYIKRITKESVERFVRIIGDKAGIDHAHPHRFRVTRITILLKRGMKLEEVQYLAGHTNINMTLKYNRQDFDIIKNSYMRVG